MAAEKRELVFKNWRTGQEAGRVDVTGMSEREIGRIEGRMLATAEADWFVDEIVTPAGPPSADRDQEGGERGES